MSYFEKQGEELQLDDYGDALISNHTQDRSHFLTSQSAQNEQIISLLQMLGIPFVNAPFEAEAQCAMLEKLRLVDGTATEDSDALLFGCNKVYKCLFSHNSNPMEYAQVRVTSELGLETDDLIIMALFMGCDYTPGVKGIAAVNATEIINCFGSTEEDLKRFRSWVDINTQIKDKLENKEAIEKVTAKDKLLLEIADALEDEARERSQTEIEKEYLMKHRNLRKHWIFPDDFPNFEVIKAYKEPNVDRSSDTFTWGKPDFAKIRRFVLNELNWRESDVIKYVDIVEKRTKELALKRKGQLENYFKPAQPATDKQLKSRRVDQAIADLKHKRRRLEKH